MNPYYDNFEKCQLTTKIAEQKGDYYAFDETIFYGEKGGELPDKGTINGLEVTDLKWEGETLFHQVAGELSDPIEMQVDERTRKINTTVQTAFHLLDGFYATKGITVTAVHANPEHQWYEIDVVDASEDLLHETEAFIQKVIAEAAPVTFTYSKGADYPDPFYQKFAELRLAHIGDYNTQPCGTHHVNHTGQIHQFVILGTEKGKKKHTRIRIAVGPVAADALHYWYDLGKEVAQLVGTSEETLVDKVDELLGNKKVQKQQVKDLTKQVLTYRTKEILAQTETFVTYESENKNELPQIAQLIAKEATQDYVLIQKVADSFQFALISPTKKAREIFAKIKASHPEVSGGGSPQIVTARVNTVAREDIINWIKATI